MAPYDVVGLEGSSFFKSEIDKQTRRGGVHVFRTRARHSMRVRRTWSPATPDSESW